VSEAPGSTRLVVPPRHAGSRLDRFLAEATALSRRAARRLAEAGLVWRNGRPVRVLSRRLETGDVVDVLRPPDELGVPPRPELPAPRIVWEDRWLVVADKPAGMLSQPAEGQDPDELALDQQLVLYLALREGRRPRLHLAHRLDRLTSGLLLFTRLPEAAAAVERAWREGRVNRTYLALVEGVPEWDRRRIEAPIGRDPGHAWRFRVDPRGREAVTEAEVTLRLPAAALVRCRLVSGRTHQVRVHLAHAGHPVVGDLLYGARPGRARRPLLHAARLVLPHPRTGRPLDLVAPLPADLRSALPPDLDERALVAGG